MMFFRASPAAVCDRPHLSALTEGRVTHTLGHAGGVTPTAFFALTWVDTTNSCVAVMEGGEPKVIVNEEGSRHSRFSIVFS